MKRNLIHIGIALVALFTALACSGWHDLLVNSIAMASVMVYLWITEAIPIYMTALIPFILGGPLGVIDDDMIARSYGDKNVFLFLGGFVMALSLEKWNVHKQVARGIISTVGQSKPRILLGFMLSTALLSMWISNTATTLMMLPMALAVLAVLPTQEGRKFPLFLLLSIAYSASIGGMATLVGSPPNIQMAGILEANFNISIDFVQWMKYGFPLTVLMIAIAFGFFYLLMGGERKEAPEKVDLTPEPWTKNQKRVAVAFLIVVLLWVFRKSIVDITGLNFNDTNVALFGSLLLFLIPSTESSGALLTWSDSKELPWGILLLFGGGLALAKSLEVNGAIDLLSSLFDTFTTWNYFLLMLMLIAISIFGTELMSNLALVTVFVPVVGAFALQSEFSILQLCVPITLAASCAFMLPVGTPPNAIVFSSGRITVANMAKYGFVLNAVALLLISTLAYLFIA